MKKITKQHGFITLFFILGISFTFLTWISLSSQRTFDYIRIKNEFIYHRSKLHNNLLCADSFVNNQIKSDQSDTFIDNKYVFIRNMYYKDVYMCHIDSINIVYENYKIKHFFFIIDDYMYKYSFENGFVKFVNSSNLF